MNFNGIYKISPASMVVWLLMVGGIMIDKYYQLNNRAFTAHNIKFYIHITTAGWDYYH